MRVEEKSSLPSVVSEPQGVTSAPCLDLSLHRNISFGPSSRLFESSRAFPDRSPLVHPDLRRPKDIICRCSYRPSDRHALLPSLVRRKTSADLWHVRPEFASAADRD